MASGSRDGQNWTILRITIPDMWLAVPWGWCIFKEDHKWETLSYTKLRFKMKFTACGKHRTCSHTGWVGEEQFDNTCYHAISIDSQQSTANWNMNWIGHWWPSSFRCCPFLITLRLASLMEPKSKMLSTRVRRLYFATVVVFDCARMADYSITKCIELSWQYFIKQWPGDIGTLGDWLSNQLRAGWH